MNERGIFGETAESFKVIFWNLVGAPMNTFCGLGGSLSTDELLDLVHKLGFELAVTNRFPSTVSAFLEISEESKLIIINGNKHPLNQIVSVAHETSHVLLHSNRVGLRFDTVEEFQADLLSFLLINKRLTSQQLEVLAHNNPDTAATVLTALLLGVTTLTVMGLAKLENWLEWYTSFDEPGHLIQPLSNRCQSMFRMHTLSSLNFGATLPRSLGIKRGEIENSISRSRRRVTPFQFTIKTLGDRSTKLRMKRRRKHSSSPCPGIILEHALIKGIVPGIVRHG